MTNVNTPDVFDATRKALQNLLKFEFGGVLKPAGFVAARRRRVWVRRADEVEHVIEVTKRYGRFSIQWGLVCPELVDVLWGTPYVPFDVAWAIITGYPSSLRHPAKAEHFEEAELTEDYARVATGVREDLEIVEAWMRPLSTRAAVRDALLEAREERGRPPWIVPGSRLALFIAASLAALDRAESACKLVAEAELELASFKDDINQARLHRLRGLAAGLCDGPTDQAQVIA